MEEVDKKNNNQSIQASRYQQQWMYETARKNNNKESELQETLMETLNRIETKLDILLMQRYK
ncbi:hypothetical protein [Peribacillus huizhouensis]|uniref:Uncharacterized protein n=1 Tax=Peribacillus huizhouensis TaxID=1501239 RepID=A0ABR6CKZ2_9BACI|nr:hypothetical protein [Peribacillus huizhouensis]MBA9025668.1 hypothetical protein [Peribacillus huizhouensis]